MNARSVTKEASRKEAPTVPPPVARKSHVGTARSRAVAALSAPLWAMAGVARSVTPTTARQREASLASRVVSARLEVFDSRCRRRIYS
jgi:hypothetical protein